MAGLSLLGGWPGIVLMVAAVPPVVKLARRRRPDARAETAKNIQGGH
jgi:hypothetical protein